MNNPLIKLHDWFLSTLKSITDERAKNTDTEYEQSRDFHSTEELSSAFDGIDQVLLEINDEINSDKSNTSTLDPIETTSQQAEQPHPQEEDNFAELEPVGVNVTGEVSEPIEIQISDIKEDVEIPPEPASALNNVMFIKLIEQNCDLIKEFEGYAERMTNEESRDIIELITQRLREAMYLAGAVPIEGEASYNILRHIPVPISLAKEGTPIVETIEPGVAIENRVFIKAKVKL